MEKEWVWLEAFKRILIDKEIITKDEWHDIIDKVRRDDWDARHGDLNARFNEIIDV